MTKIFRFDAIIKEVGEAIRSYMERVAPQSNHHSIVYTNRLTGVTEKREEVSDKGSKIPQKSFTRLSSLLFVSAASLSSFVLHGYQKSIRGSDGLLQRDLSVLASGLEQLHPKNASRRHTMAFKTP